VAQAIDEFDCATSGDTNLTDYFCNGTDLYEVNLHCWNLTAPIDGTLEIFGDTYYFDVQQDMDVTADYVCDHDGYYIDSVKTEIKCTDADKGSNKPGKNHSAGYDQAGFEIKNLGYDESCDVAP
jgi:hypothetical protein